MSEVAAIDFDELVARASELLRERGNPKRHRVACALKCGSGRVYLGIHVFSRRVNVCAEMVALGQAIAEGENEIVASVAVMKSENQDAIVPVSPCGMCRELLTYYSEDCRVLVVDGNDTTDVAAKELLPMPWRFPDGDPDPTR